MSILLMPDHNIYPFNFDHFKYRLPLDDPRKLLSCLECVLRQYNPDVILTSYGDTWLFSYLEIISEKTGIPFNPNRDLAQSIHRKKEISFHQLWSGALSRRAGASLWTLAY